MEDKEIIELYIKRIPEALEKTKEKYEKFLFAVSFRILNNFEDSEESVNDTLLASWNTIPPKIPKVFKMFLAKLARNISFNKYEHLTALKRGGGEIEIALDELNECAEDFKSSEDEFFLGELGKTVEEFLKTLPQKERNIFLRRYFFTESYKEIAKRYSINENNTAVILTRTRKKLRQYLIKEGYING